MTSPKQPVTPSQPVSDAEVSALEARLTSPNLAEIYEIARDAIAECERLQALHLERTKLTESVIVQRDEARLKLDRLESATAQQSHRLSEDAAPASAETRGANPAGSTTAQSQALPEEVREALGAIDSVRYQLRENSTILADGDLQRFADNLEKALTHIRSTTPAAGVPAGMKQWEQERTLKWLNDYIMRHPKVQTEISMKARAQIELGIAESLLKGEESPRSFSSGDYDTDFLDKLDRVLDLIPDAPAVGDASGWRDIATAPRDGTHILVRGLDGTVVTSCWASGQWKLVEYRGGVDEWMPLPQPPEKT